MRAARLTAASTFLIAITAAAQIRGVPPSVTSIGGSHSPGVPASVTSINNTPRCCRTTLFQNNVPGFGQHRRFRGRFVAAGFQPLFIEAPVAVPVEVPVAVMEDGSVAEVAEAPAPRVRARPQPAYDEQRAPAAAAAKIVEVPAARPDENPKPLPATILVFRDGRRAEVRDYAISGDTFYDLSQGLTKKIRLSDLDLDATVKANEDRGVPFSLPKRSG